MNTRLLAAVGLAAILGGTTAVTLAQPPAGPGPEGPGRGPRGGAGRLADFGLRGIDLTEAQRDQIRTIMQSHEDATRAAHTKLREAHRALAEATRAETIDEAAIRARSAEVATAMADEAILRSKVRAEVLAILTTEQQATLKERQPTMQQWRQERQKRRQ
jgi:periplasmic protein CpxP/Spy